MAHRPASVDRSSHHGSGVGAAGLVPPDDEHAMMAGRMGQDVTSEHFTPQALQRFSQRMEQQLHTLQELLSRPDFGQGERSLGAELEMSFVKSDRSPALINRAVLDRLADPRFTLELNRFNLEFNAPFAAWTAASFRQLGAWLEEGLGLAKNAARELAADVVAIGVLPTLTRSDLDASAMTDSARYRTLQAQLRQRRGGPFHIEIDGDEPLDVFTDHVTFEGANTSLQLHLRVEPGEFATIYNAAQLATAPALAVAVNSPIFLRHCLWQETRVALFKQSVDHRWRVPGGTAEAPRVGFGTRWVETPLELFADSVNSYHPLLPVCSDDEPTSHTDGPTLAELRLHHGTVWKWNRAVYDPALGGHLRIEFRALPSGPSVVDMVANSAFLIGLTLGLAKDMAEFVRHLDFDLAHENFYRAAQHGPGAVLSWLEEGRVVRCKAADLVPELIQTAESGLTRAGVDCSEARQLLDIIRQRVSSGQTGASWQRRSLAELESAGHSRASALRHMLNSYLEHSQDNKPVHEW